VPANAAEAITSAMQGDAQILRIESDHTRKWQGIPSDTQYSNQWALPKISWDQVYGTANPRFFTKVAILDTGVDATHPDLNGVIAPGYSVFDGSSPFTDENGHGTWVAGIVAARTDNLQGIAGVGYDHVQVMPVKVLDPNGLGQDSDVIQGVMWATDNGASVILMAFSASGFSDALQDAIDYAWAHNVVLVAAVGNDADNTATFPAGDRGK
jgi:subtilisin family serine protease